MATILHGVNKSLCFSTLLVLICLWVLFSTSNDTQKSSSALPKHVTAGSSKDGLPRRPGIWMPGDAIPISVFEDDTPVNGDGTTRSSEYENCPSHEACNDAIVTPEQCAKIGAPIGVDTSTALTCPDCPACPAPNKHMTLPENRPLIIYAYYESDFARRNLEFFVAHGLHSAADFVFVLNGETDVDFTVIFKEEDEETQKARKWGWSNVFIKRRDNTCFDLGAHNEVLNGPLGGQGWVGMAGPIPSPDDPIPEGQTAGPGQDKRPLKERYKRYILMNASVRGPFVPPWSTSCWSDAYLNKITPKVKLVGMSYNCHTNAGHIQSMIWATDSVGLQHILSPSGIGDCFADMPAAQQGEIRTTALLREAGFEVDAFLSVYHSKDKATKAQRLAAQASNPSTEGEDQAIKAAKDVAELMSPGDFWKECHDEDWLGPGSYFGTFVHPYENMFMKSHRGIEDTVLDRLTEWHDGAGYQSYDFCQ